MAEHKDSVRDERVESRGARVEGTTPAGMDSSPRRRSSSNDETAAASEPMELQRLPEDVAKKPEGRQRTGDPPPRRKT